MDPGRTVMVDGVLIHALDLESAVHTIVRSAASGAGGAVVTPNVDHLRMLRDPTSEALRNAYRRATLVLADGQPVVWASRLRGDPLPGRVAGSDLWWALNAAAGACDLAVAVIGGQEGVADRAAAAIRNQTPGLRVVLSEGPELSPSPTRAEVRPMAVKVAESGADIVFLAFGCPKQEIAAAHLRLLVPDTWVVCVGAAVDFAAGKVRRAPRAFRALGFEWLYRLVQEPRRLARRYLLADAPYCIGLLLRSLMARAY